jgi:hypothetical protein
MKNILTLGLLFGAAAFSQAVIVGVETFDTDGLIADQTGGTGFNYDNLNSATTATASDWDNVGGTPSVVGGQLVTNNTSAKREYNGNLEGSGTGDGPDSERAGAARGAGVVFYSVELTRTAGAVWSGISTYDFGAERVFFGVPGGAGAATDTIGISESGVGNTLGTLSLTDGVAHNIVAVVDFDNDLLGLFLDPDPSGAFWDVSDGSNSADVTRDYTGSNWSTAARLGSGGEASWDNMTIGLNDPTDVGLLAANPVPELSTSLFGSLAALLLFRRRR